MEVIVHDDAVEAASTVADEIGRAIRGRTDRFSFGLAGGSTPEPVYQRLRAADLPWERVDGWLSDERWVAPESDRSNGRMISTILFDHVPARLHRPEWDSGSTAEGAATKYEETLLSLDSGHPDLILLGMGDDGHTASLFPGSEALNEQDRLFVANVIPATSEVRLTATYPLLRQASQVIFLVVGESKADALRNSLRGETPAGRVMEGNDQVVWHVDRSAASLL